MIRATADGWAERDATFADLVSLSAQQRDDPAAAAAFQQALSSFERQNGPVYAMATFEAGAAALTTGRKARLFIETSWSAATNAQLSSILHDCEEAAIIATAALRGTSRTVALQLLFHASTTALSLAEQATDDAKSGPGLDDVAKSVRDARAYIASAAERRTQIRYGSTLILVVALAAAGLAVAVIADVDAVVAALGGCIGAGVSALQRRAHERLDSDAPPVFTISAAVVPAAVGAAFAVALYFALESGLVGLRVVARDKTEFYAVAGFLAGLLAPLAYGVSTVSESSRARPTGEISRAAAEPLSTDVVKDVLERSLENAFRGPPVVNWDGFVAVDLRRRGRPLEIVDGRAVADLNEEFEIQVTFSGDRPSDASSTAAHIVLADGVEAKRAPFDVFLDSDDLEFAQASQSALVPMRGRQTIKTAAIPRTSGRTGIWTHIRQGGRTLHVLETRLVVGGAESLEPAEDDHED
jgi:hypothetical protein